MSILQDMADLWAILWNGGTGGLHGIANFLQLDILELYLLSYGYTEPPESGVIRTVYDSMVEVFGAVHLTETMTLADVSVFSLMFALGITFILSFSIVKWFLNVLP